MTIAADDLGLLGTLGTALGIFDAAGDPNPDWFGAPQDSLATMLAEDFQREALIAFVDEALAGEERETDPSGVVWLPVVSLDDPQLDVSVMIDSSKPAGVDIGIGLEFRTDAPATKTTIGVWLFRARKSGGPAVPEPVLLGQPGGRILIATSIVVDDSPPVPGQARLGSVGLSVDLATADDDPKDSVFGLTLGGLQLPGAPTPRDLSLSADGVGELDDALIDLTFSLVKAQADAAATTFPELTALAGLLGLVDGDAVPDFPVTALPVQGVSALSAWLMGIVTTSANRADWLGHLATLLGGTVASDAVGDSDAVAFALGGGAGLRLRLGVDTGPSGHPRLTPSLSVTLGTAAARVEARADLFCVDLVTGSTVALPSFGVWAASGRAGDPVLDITTPTTVRADTLRIGFGLDATRRATFVLAADGVRLGTHDYPVLDLTSPDAVMDAVGNTVGDVAVELLGELGGALDVVSMLLGLSPPAGVSAVPVAALLTDPLDAVAGYWRSLLTDPAADPAVRTVLTELRTAISDATVGTATIQGDGTPADPWRVPLIGPLELEVSVDGEVASVCLAVSTRVDTLGQRCTVVETRFAACLAEVDLAGRTVSLLPQVEATLRARERGVRPPSVTLQTGPGATVTAAGVGLRVGWSAPDGLSVGVIAPDLTLHLGATDIPVVVPEVGEDGSVSLPPAGWDSVEALVGYLAELVGGVVGDLAAVLGWSSPTPTAGGDPRVPGVHLRLADLIGDPAGALARWLPTVAVGELAPRALALLADLLAGSGPTRGYLRGTGHPDDPYRIGLGPALPELALPEPALPELALWLPPAGLTPRTVAAPETIRAWRPGQPALPPEALAVALTAEAEIDEGLAQLVAGRDLSVGLAALAQRWTDGDGRIVPPPTPPTGVTVVTTAVGAGQLLGEIDLEDLLGRVPTTTVYVGLGTQAWPDAPVERQVNLGTPGLTPSMFVLPAPATGDWFVSLGTRGDCQAADSTTDGTPEQAARLVRFVELLGGVASDIAIVALAGSGHAARIVAQATPAVTSLVTLGTPLSPIALTAVTTQPTADALRLLHRLLPPAGSDIEDDDLRLARTLVAAMMELVAQTDPGRDLRIPAIPFDLPRAGLQVVGVFGAVTTDQVGRAMTAAVAAGLASRARARASGTGVSPLTPPARVQATGVRAGLLFTLPPRAAGNLVVSGDARLTLAGVDAASGEAAPAVTTARELRVRLRVGDRSGWLSSTPEVDLRSVSLDLSVPLDGVSPGRSTIRLHDARIFGRSWESLAVGAGADAEPLLPEARALLAVLVQRLSDDVTSPSSVALTAVLRELALVAPTGGVVADAVEQLVYDPGGLIRQRLGLSSASVATAVAQLLGPLGSWVDLDGRSVSLTAGDDDAGRFGWGLQLTVSAGEVTGRLRLGRDHPSPETGGLQLLVDLAPLRVRAVWHHPGGPVPLPGGAAETVHLWPDPEPGALAAWAAAAAPSLGGHVAVEVMRRADDSVRPVIDAVLDALGLLGGAVTDGDRALRPLTGLLADPASWLRSSGSLAADPARIQALFDALRPLLGVSGAPGSPIALADGVRVTVSGAGSATRLELTLDTTPWSAPAGATGRLTGGVTAAVTVGASGPPEVDLALFVGPSGAGTGRRSVHVRLGTGGVEVFVRPSTGPDIGLVPFAGLGALAAAAEAALPFLLDTLAEQPAPVGPLVAGVGDALALRSGTPASFDHDRLRAWADDPVAQLAAAATSAAATGLNALAPLVDDFLPAAVVASATPAGAPTTLTVAVGAVACSWTPTTGSVAVAVTDVAVPGIESLSGSLAISDRGLDELSVTVGPAAIDTGSVVLRPFVTVAAGLGPAGGRRVVVGLAADDLHRFAARWLLDGGDFALISSDGALVGAVDSTDPGLVALRLIEVVADVVAAVAMSTDAVEAVLDTPVGATPVRDLLAGVLLDDADPTQLIDGLFDVATVLPRVHTLAGNLGEAGLSVTHQGMTLSLLTLGGEIGFQLGLAERLALIEGDVALWLETDDSWIIPDPPGEGGIFVGLMSAAPPLAFRPTVTVNGVGLRIGSSTGPLLDSFITINSVALHGYGALDLTGPPSWGVHLQLSDLAVPPGGDGGDNAVASGVMSDTGTQPPQLAFSPGLSVQRHGHDPIEVTLRAGDGDGPWWIAIQRGFGPLYLEQIGFGVGVANHRVERVSVLMDGSVSMFGLTCAVDDLQVTYVISNGSFFDASSWAVDLAGLAVSADMAGLSIAGGLLKQNTEQGIEYLGMLMARFGVYGITIFGGYGQGDDHGTPFTAFFAIGAVNGPIGGPPAFFLTGIGGGFGINRELKVPTDLSRFGEYPLIRALDTAASVAEPMNQLRELGAYYPMKRGTFWFAAGLSFNSFALVDGIAVLAVEVGDGLDVTLLGLARMALPRPGVAIVSIELALLVRFSTSEGVLWVQAQLTDNSWLLYPDVRLTGGFAYVIWFKGEHRGEFVLTMGGYHPDFHRDGYPVVPRLGVHWAVGDNIVIEAGAYFALTSEAIMAGGEFHASAKFGPAWADVRFGINGIVYFDPFRYQVEAYARISAGVTINTWIFGKITISVSLGARIEVEGPDFHGRATFEVGPIELTVAFGGSTRTRNDPIPAADFIDKYLETSLTGGAQAHAVMVSFGATPSRGEASTPDGTAGRPYVVVVEFGLTFTSTVPAVEVAQVSPAGVGVSSHSPSKLLGVAPMGTTGTLPRLTLTWRRSGTAMDFPFTITPRRFGAFPVGVWGPPQDNENRKVPTAEMIEALNELDLVSAAAESPGGPTIPYHQVEISHRLPLPFTQRATDRNRLKSGGRELSERVTQPETVAEAFALADTYLAATASPTARVALRGERQAPPRMGSLGEGLDADAATVVPTVGDAPPAKRYDHFVDAPVAVGLLSGSTADLRTAQTQTTTVADIARLWKRPAPTLASVTAGRSRSIAARLVVTEPRAVPVGTNLRPGAGRRRGSASATLIGADRVPTSAVAHGAPALVRTAGGAGAKHLDAFGASLRAGRRTGRGVAGATLTPGQTVVLKLPNAGADVGDGDRPSLAATGNPARVIVLAHGGRIVDDEVIGTPDQPGLEIARGAERIVTVGLGPAPDGNGGGAKAELGLAGWHAGSRLPYVGWSTAIGPGCVIRTRGDRLPPHPERVEAGWVSGAELAKGLSTVTTTFTEPVRSVVVVLDDPEAFGDSAGARGLLLGLDGATRPTNADGTERLPVVLVSENQSTVAYDIVPDGAGPVEVTVASEDGWSLVGVLGAADTSAAAAITLISAQGLDTALRPMANGTDGSCRLSWVGATRSDRERRRAQARAAGRPLPSATGRRRR